jgi:hypothetical protein
MPGESCARPLPDHRAAALSVGLGEPLSPTALSAVEALLETVAQDRESKRQTDWAERDLALILTALLAGLRAEELSQANVGEIRTTDDGAAVIQVKGKGGKERSVPIEAELLSVIKAYLDSRAIRFPDAVKHKAAAASSNLSQWPTKSPLFVGRDGDRITRGTLQSRIKRAFRRAGPDAQPVPGALIHGLRHTYATELASCMQIVVAQLRRRQVGGLIHERQHELGVALVTDQGAQPQRRQGPGHHVPAQHARAVLEILTQIGPKPDVGRPAQIIGALSHQTGLGHHLAAGPIGADHLARAHLSGITGDAVADHAGDTVVVLL